MVPETSAFVAHALHEEYVEVDGFGRASFDLLAVTAACRAKDATVVALDCVVEEAISATITRLDEFAFERRQINTRKRLKLRNKALARIKAAAAGMQRQAGECSPEAINDLRAFFREVSKDLGNDARGVAKDPVPERGDLEIMVRVSSLDAFGDKFILSKDKHFTAYGPEISDRCGAHVIHIGYWGRAATDLGIY